LRSFQLLPFRFQIGDRKTLQKYIASKKAPVAAASPVHVHVNPIISPVFNNTVNGLVYCAFNPNCKPFFCLDTSHVAAVVSSSHSAQMAALAHIAGEVTAANIKAPAAVERKDN